MEITFDIFTFPFKDDKWLQKFGVASLLGLFGIILIIPLIPLLGYGMRAMRHTIKTGTYKLPEWDEWGDLFTDGFKYMGVGLIYSLPIIILFVCLAGAITALAASVGVTGAALDSDAAAVIATLGAVAFQLGFFVVFGLVMLLGLAIGYVSSVAVTRMVAEDDFNAALQFGEVWQMARDGASAFVLAYLLFFGVSIAVSFLYQIMAFTFILLCLMPFIIGVQYAYIYVVNGALFGTAYRHATGIEETPPSEPVPTV